MIELTKEQTYELILHHKEQNKKVNVKYVTKLKRVCLRCTTPIYVGYDKVTKIREIYCDECAETEMNGERNPVKKKIQHRFIQQIDTHKYKFFENLFKNIYPERSPLFSNHFMASIRSFFGIYSRRIFPPFVYISRCPR